THEAARGAAARRHRRARGVAPPLQRAADLRKVQQAHPRREPSPRRRPRGADMPALRRAAGRLTMATRLRERYRKEIAPVLMRDLACTNPMALPRLEKIVLNMGLGEATQNPKLLDSAVDELSAITGQKAVITRSKKAIANFKLREGMPIGTM